MAVTEKMILLPQLQVGDESEGPRSSRGMSATGLTVVTGPHDARSPAGDTGLAPLDEGDPSDGPPSADGDPASIDPDGLVVPPADDAEARPASSMTGDAEPAVTPEVSIPVESSGRTDGDADSAVDRPPPWTDDERVV